MKDFNNKSSEEKIEILDGMINKNNKKIKFREDFLPFSALWIKVHLLIPAITLLGTITSCLLPVSGLLESLYSYILFGWVYSLAVLASCSVLVPTRFILSKTLKSLKNKNESMEQLRNNLESELQQELLISKEKTEDTNSYDSEDDKQSSYEVPTQFNFEGLFDYNLNNEEQENNSNNELSGPKLVKKRFSTNNKYDK